MTRKRFKKLLMQYGYSKNALNHACDALIKKRDEMNAEARAKHTDYYYVTWGYIFNQFIVRDDVHDMALKFNRGWRNEVWRKPE